jgi:predicted Zn-dependent protease
MDIQTLISRFRSRRSLLLVTALAVTVAACAVNPATGRREFSLVSEGQEISMGRDADPEIVAEMGLYPDSAVQEYVRNMGMRLAAESERPDLPWTFRVLDDPTVNAFALPGGFVYVTRGILTHLNSEAQLAGVLGHEIGHVTARHGASRMSRSQLAQIGLAAGMIFSEEVRRFGGVAQQAMGLLFLRFGRGDELEADELGLRYMTRLGYDPAEMAGVMRMLDDNSQLSEGSGRVPEWLSTHPDPGNRVTRINERIAQSPEWGSASRVDRSALMARLDGMTFGPNPREGFLREGIFHHPDLAFRFQIPSGWGLYNGKAAVQVAPEDGSAVLELKLAQVPPDESARAFAAQEGVTPGTSRATTINDLEAVVLPFRAAAQDGTLQGEMTWISHDGNTYALMALSTEAGWDGAAPALRGAVGSFAPETDPEILEAEPLRVQVRTLQSATPLGSFLRQYPSGVEERIVAVINQVEPDGTLPSGPAKQVVRR